MAEPLRRVYVPLVRAAYLRTGMAYNKFTPRGCFEAKSRQVHSATCCLANVILDTYMSMIEDPSSFQSAESGAGTSVLHSPRLLDALLALAAAAEVEGPARVARAS